jgi:hypothetical protein
MIMAEDAVDWFQGLERGQVTKGGLMTIRLRSRIGRGALGVVLVIGGAAFFTDAASITEPSIHTLRPVVGCCRVLDYVFQTQHPWPMFAWVEFVLAVLLLVEGGRAVWLAVSKGRYQARGAVQ